MARLDYEVLENHLAQWNPAKTDPVWTLRKAGILAEIDRNQDAMALLKHALTEIRRHRRRDLDDLPALSREAWALWLVLAYRHGFPHMDKALVDTHEPFDRWRELAVHDCNANFEYKFLLAELEKIEDEPQDSIIKEPTFDLGQVTVSYRFRGTSRRVLASYQMMRLAEVTGLPHGANQYRVHRHTCPPALRGAAAPALSGSPVFYLQPPVVQGPGLGGRQVPLRTA